MKFLIFIATFAVSLVITPRLVHLSSRFGVSYHAGDGSVRSRIAPLLGGLSIYISFLFITVVVFLLSRGKMLGEYDYQYLGIILGGSLMLALGIYDDVRGAPRPLKIAVQTLGALILIGCGYRITTISCFLCGKIEIGAWGIPLLVIWIVGVTNALSLIDKIDGLACGVATICGVTLFFAGISGPPFAPVLALAVAGSAAGFLRYNFYPARIFPGSGGTLFLGFVLAAVAAQGSFKITAGITLMIPLLALLTVLFNYFHSTLSRRPGKDGDRQLHNRLILMGYSPKQSVLILYILQANLGTIALVMAYAGRTLAIAIFFLVGSMLYILFRIMEDYRARILELEGHGEEQPVISDQ